MNSWINNDRVTIDRIFNYFFYQNYDSIYLKLTAS